MKRSVHFSHTVGARWITKSILFVKIRLFKSLCLLIYNKVGHHFCRSEISLTWRMILFLVSVLQRLWRCSTHMCGKEPLTIGLLLNLFCHTRLPSIVLLGRSGKSSWRVLETEIWELWNFQYANHSTINSGSGIPGEIFEYLGINKYILWGCPLFREHRKVMHVLFWVARGWRREGTSLKTFLVRYIALIYFWFSAGFVRGSSLDYLPYLVFCGPWAS